MSYIFYLQPLKKKQKSIYYCPHCQRNLSWKAFVNHRKLYFNVNTNHWISDADISRSADHVVGGVLSQEDVQDTSESPPLSPSDSLVFTPIESRESDTFIDPPNEGKGLQDL